MGAEDDLIGEMDSFATDHGTKAFREADKAKRWENDEEEEERFVEDEFESNARLEDVAVSSTLSAASEFSSHSLASCDQLCTMKRPRSSMILVRTNLYLTLAFVA